MDKVFIEGLAVEAVIGIHDWERRVRQALVLDVELSFDNRVPAATDAIADAHDYEAIGKRLVAFVAQTQVKLVETLAERCAALLLEEFGVRKVRLKLTKPGALPGARAVGVVIKRERHRDDEDAEKEDKDEQDDAAADAVDGAQPQLAASEPLPSASPRLEAPVVRTRSHRASAPGCVSVARPT